MVGILHAGRYSLIIYKEVSRVKIKYLITICVLSFVIITQSKNVFAITVDLKASVIGMAIDAEYDGVFETLHDRYPLAEFNSFSIGRVMDGNWASERRGILEFDLSSVNSGSQIDSATLILDWASASNTPGTIVFHGYTGNGNLNVTNATNTGNIVASRTALPLDHDVSVDVTSFIQNLIDGGNNWAGFLGIETVDGAMANFRAEPDYYFDWDAELCSILPEYCGVEPELIQPNPRLLVNYSVVPVPAAIWLFGSGLIGLIGLAKRKKA